MTDPVLRLNKQLALQLGISRREADDYIAAGKVTVNGVTATLGARYAETDDIAIGGKKLGQQTDFVYLALNKPVGYVCSRKSQGDSPTIYTLLPKEYHTLKPVGRLDKNSSGLLLLTNDGDFAHRMTHPKFAKTKIYKIKIDHDLEPLHQQMISDHGIQLEDGRSQLMLERLSDSNRHEWQVTMSEGRNRQIRRTFASLGYEVKKLHRIQFGIYTLSKLASGSYMVIKI